MPKQAVLAVIGPSGQGKSTLLRCLAGFEVLQSGHIKLDEKTLVAPGVFLPPEKRDIGVVPQTFCLFPHLSVEDNIAFGLFRLGKKEKLSRVQELIELTRLQDCRQALPCDISGGQQQRVALARALAPRPKLLLMDEPFANLDDQLKRGLQDSLIETFEHNKVTCVCLLYTSPSPRDRQKSRMPSSA